MHLIGKLIERHICTKRLLAFAKVIHWFMWGAGLTPRCQWQFEWLFQLKSGRPWAVPFHSRILACKVAAPAQILIHIGNPFQPHYQRWERKSKVADLHRAYLEEWMGADYLYQLKQHTLVQGKKGAGGDRGEGGLS